MRRILSLPIMVISVTLILTAAASADIVILKSGGRIEGEVIDNGDSVTVRIKEGVSTTIPRKDIKEVIIRKSALQMYEEKSQTLADDDALGHYALGLWCLDESLTREAMKEFEIVIGIDPEHEGARKKLGHEKIDGKWLTKDEVMLRNGFVKYKGQWLKKEEAEKRRHKDELEDSIDEWAKEIERAKGEPPLDVIEKLSSIADPAGVEALTKELKSRSEHVRAAAADSLGLIGDLKPGKALLRMVMKDRYRSVRAACAKAVHKICTRNGKFDLVNSIIRTMFKQGAPKERETAAEALGYIGDRMYISYLIKALVVKVKVRDKSGDEFDPFSGGTPKPGKGTRVTGTTSAGGISAGTVDDKPKIVEKNNPKALAALKKITGRDFGFDQDAWKEWHLKDLEKRAEKLEKEGESGK